MVAGKLSHLNLILVNIYAPNFDDDQFFRKMFSTIPNLDDHHLILAGDYNLVLSPADRSSQSTLKLSKSAQIIQTFMDAHKLVDPWRNKNPHKKEYSYFSNVHVFLQNRFLFDRSLLIEYY